MLLLELDVGVRGILLMLDISLGIVPDFELNRRTVSQAVSLKKKTEKKTDGKSRGKFFGHRAESRIWDTNDEKNRGTA